MSRYVFAAPFVATQKPDATGAVETVKPGRTQALRKVAGQAMVGPLMLKASTRF
jgi:hypothetical protein